MINIKISTLLTVFIFYLLLLTGCQEYSEVKTTPGTVPPPPGRLDTVPVPPAQEQAPAPSPSTPPLSRKAKEAQRSVAKEEIISKFGELYPAKGSPRMAIYLNKTFSDEIREWRADKRLSITGEGQHLGVSSTDNKSDAGSSANINADVVNIQNNNKNKNAVELQGSADKQRTMTVQTQQYIEDEKRRGPEEQMMWAFEEGFLDTFITAKTNVVDRAVMLRLAAVDSDKQDRVQNDGLKKIEMDALSQYADIIIEVLVSKTTIQNFENVSRESTTNQSTISLTTNSTEAKPQGLEQSANTKSKYEEFMRGVVIIKSSVGTGTGFFVTPEGYIITNKHVVGENDKQVSVKTFDGKTIPGQVILKAVGPDLAIVKVSETPQNWLNLAGEEEYKTGIATLAIGTPIGLEWSVSQGILSAVRNYDGVLYMQTDTPINQGNSGGPLISLETGNVIGVNTFTVKKDIAEGLNFAIASTEIKSAFPALTISSGTITSQAVSVQNMPLASTSESFSRCRYVFKATAKEIKSGRILASVTTADWKGRKACEGTIIATSDGYKFDGGMSPSNIKDIASDLAAEVMKKLIQQWK